MIIALNHQIQNIVNCKSLLSTFQAIVQSVSGRISESSVLLWVEEKPWVAVQCVLLLTGAPAVLFTPQLQCAGMRWEKGSASKAWKARCPRQKGWHLGTCGSSGHRKLRKYIIVNTMLTKMLLDRMWLRHMNQIQRDKFPF